MKLVFCGTPEFAVPTLRAVLGAGHEVALVLTQPDRPSGRKLALHAPPVKELALQHGLPVLQPEKIRNNLELQDTLVRIQPEAILVVAYGRIVPPWMLALPKFGNLNLHGSLLPKYRGAAPIQWAVARGETETGVSTMRLDAGLDTGDVLLESRRKIQPDVMATELFSSLAVDGAALILQTLDGLRDGTIQARPQDHAQATLAPILTRDDGRLSLKQRCAAEVYDRWRGFYPWPGAWDLFRGKRFLVHALRPVVATPAALGPGVLGVHNGQLRAGAAQGTALELLEVQVEGRPRLSGERFARDYQLQTGEELG